MTPPPASGALPAAANAQGPGSPRPPAGPRACAPSRRRPTQVWRPPAPPGPAARPRPHPRRHSGAPVRRRRRRAGGELAGGAAELSAAGRARPDPAPPRPRFPPSGGSRAIRPGAGRERQLEGRPHRRAPSRERPEPPLTGACAW